MGVDAVVRVDDGVVVGLGPLTEEGVREVGRVGDVLLLTLVGGSMPVYMMVEMSLGRMVAEPNQ